MKSLLRIFLLVAIAGTALAQQKTILQHPGTKEILDDIVVPTAREIDVKSGGKLTLRDGAQITLPDATFGIEKVSGLQAALDSKETPAAAQSKADAAQAAAEATAAADATAKADAAEAAAIAAAALDATSKATAAQAAASQRDNHTGTQTADTISNFASAASAAAPVQSVAGRSGAVTLAKADVGLANVDNTSDLAKPISTATQAALDAKLAASAFTGAAARDLLAGLSGENRLDASAIKNLPEGGDPNALTAGSAAPAANRVWVSGGADRSSVATPVAIAPDTGAMTVPSISADAVSATSLLFTGDAEPTTPAAGMFAPWVNSGVLTLKDSSGTNTPVGSGGAGTASEIRDALETLSGENRLDASAIKNLVTADLPPRSSILWPTADLAEAPADWVTTGTHGTGTGGTLGAYSLITRTYGTVAAPTFSPVAGEVEENDTVTITTATSGASIRYTTNGDDPTRSSGTVYSGPVAITEALNLKAIAYRDFWQDSSISSAAYTVASNDPVLRDTRYGDANDMQAFHTTGAEYVATAWTTGGAYTLTRIDLRLRRVNVNTGNITVHVYSDNSGNPGTLLATSTTTLDSATLTSTNTYYTFNFAGLSLASATRYHVVLYKEGITNGTNYVAWRGSNTGGDGYRRSPDATTWTLIGAAYTGSFDTWGTD